MKTKMSRSKRKVTAEETLAIIERGGYDIGGLNIDLQSDICGAIAAARLLRPDDLVQMSQQALGDPQHETVISVANETTLEAAQRLAVEARDKEAFVLNFASAKNPGGGFLGGSQAQEESIARSSALYPTLTACLEYYEVNRGNDTSLYTDYMIYSPRVPVFRNDAGELLEEPYLISVLTSPAVNAGAVKRNEPAKASEIEGTMRRRMGYALHAALSLGYEDLVLGAWGCGVFRNDPTQIARLFAEYLLPGGVFAGQFRKVEFAVLDTKGDRQIIGPFESALTGVST